MNLVSKTADTMAFTIDFGQQEINHEEKVKKFERFAQRSSLRRVNSPRQQEREKQGEESKTNNNNNNNNNSNNTSVSSDSGRKAPQQTSKTTSPASPPTSAPKERRGTVVLERSPALGPAPARSLSHNRLSARKPLGSRPRKSSGNEDALSHTGTYTMDMDEQDLKKDLPNVSAVDKTSYVADWTAKHSSESAAAAARRRLPSAPSKDELADESLREVEKILARSELSAGGTTTSNIRPGYKPSVKPLIESCGGGAGAGHGATSYRSLPYSTNYAQPRERERGAGESAASRASIRRKPVSSTSFMVSRTQGAANRSNSCLTSQQAEYQAWKTQRKETVTKKPGGSVSSSCNSSSSSASSAAAAGKAAAGAKLPGRMTQSLVTAAASGSMKRSNSFHHENLAAGLGGGGAGGGGAAGPEEPRTYRTSDDYYLDEDELFLPLYSTEEDHVEAVRGPRKDQVSALDSLGKKTHSFYQHGW